MPRTENTVRRKPNRSIEVVRRALDDESDEAELLDVDLLRAIEQVEGIQDASVRIYRQGMHGRDLIYIDDVPPANFNLTMLKHAPYNGGKFRVLVVNADGTFMKNSLIQVEPAPKAPEAPPAPSPVVQQIGTSNEAFVLLAKAMTDGFSRLGELIVSARVEPPKPRSTQEILNELTMMKTLFDHPAPPTDGIETMTKLLGLMKELPMGGGDGGEPGPMAVLLELAKQFGPRLLEAHDQSKVIPGQPVPRRALPTQLDIAVPPHLQSIQQQTQRKPDVNILIAQQLKFLVRQAKNENDPEPYAVMVLDNVPPTVLDSFLKRPDWFEEICKYVPDATPHREWFTALKAIIDDYLTEDTGGEQTAGDATTDGNADGIAATGDTKSDTPNT